MSFKGMVVVVIAMLGLASGIAAAASAGSASGPGRNAAGPASGFIPSHNVSHANQARGGGHISLLAWYGGPVMHSTTVVPVFWGSSWNNSVLTDDKITGLDSLYSGVGGTSYAHANSEYYDGSGPVNTSSISKATKDLTDYSATPSGAPSTAQVLAEVAKATNNAPVPNAYYPVYSDQPRGNAGYCAWHSSGTIGGTRVQFGFFFNLDNDPGCDPGAPTNLGHS